LSCFASLFSSEVSSIYGYRRRRLLFYSPPLCFCCLICYFVFFFFFVFNYGEFPPSFILPALYIFWFTLLFYHTVEPSAGLSPPYFFVNAWDFFPFRGPRICLVPVYFVPMIMVFFPCVSLIFISIRCFYCLGVAFAIYLGSAHSRLCRVPHMDNRARTCQSS